MNLREMLYEVRDILDERTTTVGSPQWQDYQLRRFLSAIQMNFVSRDIGMFPELLAESTPTATVNGTTDYSLPADFIALHGVVLGGIPCRIVKREESYARRKDAFAPTFGDPEVEVIDSEDVRFYPTPDATAPVWSAFYYKRPQDLFQQVATFEDNEAWTVSGAGGSIADVTSGLSTEEENGTEAVQMTVTAGNTGTLAYILPAAVNFGTDTTDVVELWVATNATNLTSIAIQFHTTATTHYWTTTVLPTAFAATTSGTFVRVPKSLFTVGAGSPNWASIVEIRIVQVSGGGGSSVVIYDDWRIYRSPEIDSMTHPLLCLGAAALALASDEGFRESGDAANAMAAYNAGVAAYYGKAA